MLAHTRRRIGLLLLALALQGCATARKRPVSEDWYTATAYCDHGITASGARTRPGIAAADPDHLPLGSVVRVVAAGDRRYERQYTIMDTGARVQGHRIDIFVPDCTEARAFGVRRVRVQIVRLAR